MCDVARGIASIVCFSNELQFVAEKLTTEMESPRLAAYANGQALKKRIITCKESGSVFLVL